jgi:hypothetical protein
VKRGYPLVIAASVLLVVGVIEVGRGAIGILTAGPALEVAPSPAMATPSPAMATPVTGAWRRAPRVPDPGREGAPERPGTATPGGRGGGTPVLAPTPTPAPVPSVLAPYLGTWSAHGAEMTITPNDAVEVIRLGPCRGLSAGVDCTSTATLRLDLSKGIPQLVYTGFTYADKNGVPVVPDSLEGLPVVGDGYRLRMFAPGVIELVPLTEHLRQIMGTPYRCSAAANDYAHRHLCNA